MYRIFVALFFVSASIVAPQPATALITIDTVFVGNAGNPGDVQSQGTFGAVAYNYRIGTYEVTVGQYAEFLNAVATKDTYSLYNVYMAQDLNVAGISQSGASGSYSYSVIGSANHPISFVSWGDAARFANWLHNGRPTGAQDVDTTENGAYTLNGAISREALNAVSRNAAARWFLPTENEWYKAAYHKNDGATGNYWDFPTSTDAVPYSDQPPGSDAPVQSNTANYYKTDGSANGYNDGFALTASSIHTDTQNYLTDVGAYTFSRSPYGTFDQGGNVFEWNEARIDGVGLDRGNRGGDFIRSSSENLRASFQNHANPSSGEYPTLGFRMATVPEPSSVALAALAASFGLPLVVRRKRDCPGLHHGG